MDFNDSRRGFLRRAGQLSACLATGAWASTAKAASGDEWLYQISLAEWSLHRTIFAGDLDHLDFAPESRRRYGIDAVEYVNQFFPDKAGDKNYLSEMKKRAEGEGVRGLLIMIDREGHLGDPDAAQRTQAVENHHKWVEAARYLGCHSIRVNAASRGTYDEQLALAADGLRRLTEFADPYGLNVIVENHGGLSSNGGWLSAVIRKVDHPRCGTLPDFGNFNLGDGKQYDRYQGVAELMPFAKAVSAKSHNFADDGSETHTDYRRMLGIVLDAGYRAYVGIEYEGSQLSEPEGIVATKALLERVRGELAGTYAGPSCQPVTDPCCRTYHRPRSRHGCGILRRLFGSH